jgi:hypothetical protein
MGPLWCQEHIDEIVEEILEEARTKKMSFTTDLRNFFPALSLTLPESVQKIVLKRIVQVCINRTKN